MTNDELALIRAATAEPGEDTVRLAYADWLDEQGGGVFASQAAFVRLQVRRARLDLLDPDRATLLDQEAALVRKHKRAWNGRIHRYLTRVGFPGKVDARRGLIRGWDYQRGMIARVTVTAEALTAHPDLVFALGPVEHVRLSNWPVTGWERGAVQALERHFSRLKVVSLAGTGGNLPLPNVARLPLAGVAVLDVRSVNVGVRPDELLALARSGAIPPIVLFFGPGPVPSTRPTTRRRWGRGPDPIPNPGPGDHVIDPHNKWDALRLPFANLTGEVLSPSVYQGTSR